MRSVTTWLVIERPVCYGCESPNKKLSQKDFMRNLRQSEDVDTKLSNRIYNTSRTNDQIMEILKEIGVGVADEVRESITVEEIQADELGNPTGYVITSLEYPEGRLLSHEQFEGYVGSVTPNDLLETTYERLMSVHTVSSVGELWEDRGYTMV